MKMPNVFQAKWSRVTFVLVAFCGMVAFFVLHGPKWSLVLDAFRFVAWEWVVAAIALNLLSVIARSAAWDQVIEQAVPPPQPPFKIAAVLPQAASYTLTPNAAVLTLSGQSVLVVRNRSAAPSECP